MLISGKFNANDAGKCMKLLNLCPITREQLDREEAVLIKIPKPANEPLQKDIFFYLENVGILNRFENNRCPFTSRHFSDGCFFIELSKLSASEFAVLLTSDDKDKLEEDVTKLGEMTATFSWQSWKETMPANKPGFDQERAGRLCTYTWRVMCLGLIGSAVMLSPPPRQLPENDLSPQAVILLCAIGLLMSGAIVSHYRNNLFGLFAGQSAFQRGQSFTEFLSEGMDQNYIGPTL